MSVNVGTATGYLDLDISGFLSGLKTAQTEAQSTINNIEIQTGDKFQSVGKKLTSAGTVLTKSVTLPVVGLGATIVKTGADFESSMSKVQAISGASGSDLEKLKSKAREMGATTKFSATEAADAFQYMAMAGWDVDSMMGGIEGTMNLAAASGEDLATVSDIVTDSMTAFGLSADGTSKVLKDGFEIEVDNTTRFVDALAAASNNSNTNVSMLGESFKYVAPVAGALGYSAEDTAIALGLMANQGIKASQSGTALRAMLTNMANPTDTVSAAMEKLNVSLKKDDGSMKSLMEVMQDLRKGFGQGQMDADEFSKKMQQLQSSFDEGKISEDEYVKAVEDLAVAMYGVDGAQKAALASQLAGKTGMAGLLAIVNTGEEDFNKLADSIYNANGTSKEMADIMNNNLTGQFTILLSSLQELAIQFSEILIPVIKSAVAWLQDLVAKFQALSPEQKEQIVKWAAIVAAIGPVLIALGNLVNSIGSILTVFGKIPGAITTMKSAFTVAGTSVKNFGEAFKLAKAGYTGFASQTSTLGAALGSVTAPMIAIVAIIGVLIAAFVNLWKNNEEFRNNIIAIWEGIKTKFEAFCQGIVDRLNALGFDFENITEVLAAIWDGFCSLLAPIFEAVFGQLGNILSAAMDMLTGILDVFIGIFTGNWEQAWTGIKEIFGAVWNLIKGTFESWTHAFQGTTSAILNWFGTTWDKCWTSVKNFFTGIWNGITSFFVNVIKKIKTMVSNFITAIIDYYKNLPRNIGYILGSVLGTVIKWVTNMVDKAKEVGSKFLKFIINYYTQLPGRILRFITSAYEHVTTWASNMVTKAKEMAKNFLSNVVNTIRSLPSKIKSFLDKTIENLKTWISDMGRKGTEAIQELISKVQKGAKEIPSKMMSIGTEIVNGVWEGIQNAKDKFVEKVKGFFSGIVDGVKDTLGIASPSKVFADEVGKWLPPGIAEGFESAMPKAERRIENAALKSIKKVNDLVSKYTNKSLDEYSTKVGEDLATKLAKNIEKQNEKNKKTGAAAAQVLVDAAQKTWERYSMTHSVTLADEAAFWKKIVSECKKGSDAYYEALKKYQSANNSLKDSVKSLKNDYKKAWTEIKEDLVANIQKVMDEYEQAVVSKTESIKSQFGNMFSAFKTEETEATKDILTENLRSQVNALDEWDKQMSALAGRNGISDEFMKEIEELGVGAIGQLQILNSMSDEELNEFISLWEEKNKKANEMAKKQLSDYEKECKKQVEILIKEANRNLNELEGTYEKHLKDLGVKTSKESKKIGKNIVSGIKAGMKANESSLYAYIKELCGNLVEAAMDELEINSPSKVFEKQVGKWIPLGIAEGFKSTMSEATENMQDSLDDGMDSLDANIPIGTINGISEFSDKVKDIYMQVASWFESVDEKIGKSVDSMVYKLQTLIQAGKKMIYPDDKIGYVGYSGFNPSGKSNPNQDGEEISGGRDIVERVYMIQSKERLSEKETIKELRNFERDLSEGFV